MQLYQTVEEATKETLAERLPLLAWETVFHENEMQLYQTVEEATKETLAERLPLLAWETVGGTTRISERDSELSED
ncbi:uncharacterized [Tachysurus ichikawai]